MKKEDSNLIYSKLGQDLLPLIFEHTSGRVGEEFFHQLTRFISATLNVRKAIISECINEARTSVHTLSYADHGKIIENIEYDLRNTPCDLVIKGEGKVYFMSGGVKDKYPEKEQGIESYLGVPIYAPSTRAIIGHVAVLDDKPMVDDQDHSSVLKIFASLAGAEMERMAVVKKLKRVNEQLQKLLSESEDRFRDLFDEAPIAYVHEGMDSQFLEANKAALKILGVKPEEVPKMYGKTLVTSNPQNQRRLKEAFDSIEKGTNTRGVILELKRKDNGKPIWIEWWSNPDVSGQYTRTMFIDITDKVLLEQEQARLEAQNQYLKDEIKLEHNFDEIVSKSRNFRKVLRQVEQVATTDATVLILGESGTGKELLARSVHNISNRSRRTLAKVNCAALPAQLIESELFGHERGAFTGATERKIGHFEWADGGTIFLDEVGELPMEVQPKLLRVLQEGEFQRVGSPKTIKVNVRIIAATNRNLEQAVENKEFREDLFYRLNVFPIVSPPLRERKEDIPLLVKYFCQKHAPRIGRQSITGVPPEVMTALLSYHWPGNIRELENLIERALILSTGDTLVAGDWVPVKKKSANTSNSLLTLKELERGHIIETLRKTNWRVSGEKGAAKILGLKPTTLEARMKKLGIYRDSIS